MIILRCDQFYNRFFYKNVRFLIPLQQVSDSTWYDLTLPEAYQSQTSVLLQYMSNYHFPALMAFRRLVDD